LHFFPSEIIVSRSNAWDLPLAANASHCSSFFDERFIDAERDGSALRSLQFSQLFSR